MDWEETFAELPDSRQDHVFKKHLLNDILLLSLCAVLCGAETDEEVERLMAEIKKRFYALP